MKGFGYVEFNDKSSLLTALNEGELVSWNIGNGEIFASLSRILKVRTRRCENLISALWVIIRPQKIENFKIKFSNKYKSFFNFNEFSECVNLKILERIWENFSSFQIWKNFWSFEIFEYEKIF